MDFSAIKNKLEFGIHLMGYNIKLADGPEWTDQANNCPFKIHRHETSFCFQCRMVYITPADQPTVTDYWITQWVEQIAIHYLRNDVKSESSIAILKNASSPSLRLAHE